MTLTHAENFAAGNVLTEWPEALSYDELLTAIETDSNPDILIWQQYENDLPSDIVCTIEDMRRSFLNHVADMTEDLRAAIREGDPRLIKDALIEFERQLGL